jgi:hypothetical protein
VQERAAYLAHLLWRVEAIKAENAGREDTRTQLQVARCASAVARTREVLAKAKLEALQLRAREMDI